MRALPLVAAILVACSPVSSEPTSAPASSGVIPTPVAVLSTTQPTSSESPGVETRVAPSPATLSIVLPAVSASPTAGAVHNEGQWIVAQLDPPLGFHYGEAPVAATSARNYRLNGDPFETKYLRCSDLRTSESCYELRILPAEPLVEGQSYELALLDDVLGSFVAQGLTASVPRVLSVTATQYALTVKFDRPMQHIAPSCGDAWPPHPIAGVVEYARVSRLGEAPAPGAYTSSDPRLRSWLAEVINVVALDEDCAGVTLRAEFGAPAGSFDVTVSGIADESGNLLQPSAFRVTIADESRPRVVRVAAGALDSQAVIVQYSEAMDEAHATDPDRYLLNGDPLPSDTSIECVRATCDWVILRFPPGTFEPFKPSTLTTVAPEDTAGRRLEPETVVSAPFAFGN